MSEVPPVTFGQMLRAARMRYGWSKMHGAYIRIAAAGPPYRIDVHPPGLIKADKRSEDEEYVLWWSPRPTRDPSCLEFLGKIEPLQGVSMIRKPFSFWVDEEGRAVR